TLKYQTDLKPRLAELPTITAVGMNALAPVERNGRLRPVFKNGSLAGFGTQEFAVCDPRQRVRAMSDRSLTAPAEDLELEEFQNRVQILLFKPLPHGARPRSVEPAA